MPLMSLESPRMGVEMGMDMLRELGEATHKLSCAG